jgi:hypothetical protein
MTMIIFCDGFMIILRTKKQILEISLFVQFCLCAIILWVQFGSSAESDHDF